MAANPNNQCWVVTVSGSGPDRRFLVVAAEEWRAAASVGNSIKLRGRERFSGTPMSGNVCDGMRPGEVRRYEDAPQTPPRSEPN
jgi:hypothetical protein